VARLFGEAWSRATGTAPATRVSRPPSIAVAPTDVGGSQPAHGLPVMAAHY
jgi:hypothetical protein